MGKMVFLGVEGSGKTTLMMALAKEFERRKADGFYLKPLSRDSFRFLKMLPEKIGEGTFPHQTASLRDLTWEIEENGAAVCELSILDYPGEIYRLAFLDAKDEPDPESFRQKVAANKAEIDALLNAVKTAENIYVLFNLADAEDLGGNARNLDAVWVTNACLHLLKRLESKPAIELLLTQADRYESAGIDSASFSLESIDLIGHDHADVTWRFISVVSKDNNSGIADFVNNDVVLPHLRKVAENLLQQIPEINVEVAPSNWRFSTRVDIANVNQIEASITELRTFSNRRDTSSNEVCLALENELKGIIKDWERIRNCRFYGKTISKRDLLNCAANLSNEVETKWGRRNVKSIIKSIDSYPTGTMTVFSGIAFFVLTLIITGLLFFGYKNHHAAQIWRNRSLRNVGRVLIVDVCKGGELNAKLQGNVVLIIGLDELCNGQIITVELAPDGDIQWETIFTRLKDRDIADVSYVVSRNYKGIQAACRASFPNATWQWRLSDFLAASDLKWDGKIGPAGYNQYLIRNIMDASSLGVAKQQLDNCIDECDRYGQKKMSAWLEKNINTCLAYYSMPHEYRGKELSDSRFNYIWKVIADKMNSEIKGIGASQLDLLSAICSKSGKYKVQKQYGYNWIHIAD